MFYFSFIAVVRRAAIKQKRGLVLFYFYFSFIAVVRAALNVCSLSVFRTFNIVFFRKSLLFSTEFSFSLVNTSLDERTAVPSRLNCL